MRNTVSLAEVAVDAVEQLSAVESAMRQVCGYERDWRTGTLSAQEAMTMIATTVARWQPPEPENKDPL